jgi:hypothetical protein
MKKKKKREKDLTETVEAYQANISLPERSGRDGQKLWWKCSGNGNGSEQWSNRCWSRYDSRAASQILHLKSQATERGRAHGLDNDDLADDTS